MLWNDFNLQLMFGSYNWELIDMENAMIAGHNNTHRKSVLLMVFYAASFIRQTSTQDFITIYTECEGGGSKIIMCSNLVQMMIRWTSARDCEPK